MLLFFEDSAILSIERILIILVLFLIFWQDFKKYEVRLWLYPAGFILLSLLTVVHIGLINYLIRVLQNGLFVFILMTIVWLYFRLKTDNANPFKFTDNFIGWGDILFFVLVTPAFDLFQFVLFLTVSSGAGITFSGIHYIFKKSLQKIPLAGIMAINLIVFESLIYMKIIN